MYFTCSSPLVCWIQNLVFNHATDEYWQIDNRSRYFFFLTDEQAKTAILCDNYGEAAAFDFFGGVHSLPTAIRGHQSYLSGFRDTTVRRSARSL